jgi:Flp pilus assembly protein TadD
MRQAVGDVIRRNWKLYLLLAVLAGIFFYSKIFLYNPSQKISYYGGSAISNFATVVRIICYYIKLVLFPVVLHADYSYNAFDLSQSFLEWRVLGAGLVVVGLLWVTLWSLARQGLVFFGGMWFFITLVPVSQIFPHHELMAEHYLYVPLAGVMIMVLPLLAYVLEKKQKAALGLIILIAVLFGLRTIERNRDWRDGMTLWSGVVAAAPESARGHDNLGTEYVKRKDYQTALKHYQEAVRLRPEHAIFHNNLGRAYGMLGDIKNAEAELRKAVELNPTLAEAMNNLGIVFYQKGDYTTAAWLFALSSNQKPDSRVSFNLAKTRLKLGQVKEAITEFETTIRLQPDHTDAYRELAMIFSGQGNRQESLRCLRKARDLELDATKRQQLEAAIKKIEHDG